MYVDEKYSTGNIVNNSIVTLYSDYAYHGEHGRDKDNQQLLISIFQLYNPKSKFSSTSVPNKNARGIIIASINIALSILPHPTSLGSRYYDSSPYSFQRGK